MKKNSYTALGWATWSVGKRVAKRKVRKLRPAIGSKSKLVLPLMIVAVAGAVLASRS